MNGERKACFSVDIAALKHCKSINLSRSVTIRKFAPVQDMCVIKRRERGFVPTEFEPERQCLLLCWQNAKLVQQCKSGLQLCHAHMPSSYDYGTYTCNFIISLDNWHKTRFGCCQYHRPHDHFPTHPNPCWKYSTGLMQGWISTDELNLIKKQRQWIFKVSTAYLALKHLTSTMHKK